MKPTLSDAIDVLVDALKENKTPGSYYYTWQANIAMAFQDEFVKTTQNQADLMENTTIHKISNQAAKNFLDMLIHVSTYKRSI